jgi:predicted DNA-binding protein YlxM (UPF0122 family)
MFQLPKTHEARKRYWAKRRRMMRDLLAEGWSLADIGKKYSISRQAVWRCVKNGNP